MSSPIKVLVVDDSALMRKLIPQMLESDPDIRVVGTAMDGAFALDRIARLRPDVVTLDLEMPRIDGLELLGRVKRRHQLSVVVVSAHSSEGAAKTFKALAMGAFDFVTKPKEVCALRGAVAADLISKIKAAAGSNPALASPPVGERCGPHRGFIHEFDRSPAGVMVIGASTGGPGALQHLLSNLPADFPAAILVAQHMPAPFTAPFARRLSEVCALEVKEAEPGDRLLAGRVLVARGARDLKMARTAMGAIAVLSDDPASGGHRPSVDVLFRSAARTFGAAAVALLLTGMGNDGAAGMGEVRAAGGFTIAQAERSSAVFGMARCAIQLGHAMLVADLEQLPEIVTLHWKRAANHNLTKLAVGI